MPRFGQPDTVPADYPVRSDISPSPSAVPTGESSTGGPAAISKGLFIKGEIRGSESLIIDGKVEGNIDLSGGRVTVTRNGKVEANIVAREVVISGMVLGSVTATDRVDIRSGGELTGNVTTARISIEDGAIFKGGIDIRKPITEHERDRRALATEGSALAASYDARAEESISRVRFRTVEDEDDIDDVLPKWKPAQSTFVPMKARAESH